MTETEKALVIYLAEAVGALRVLLPADNKHFDALIVGAEDLMHNIAAQSQPERKDTD